jgi:hypothetical protein
MPQALLSRRNLRKFPADFPPTSGRRPFGAPLAAEYGIELREGPQDYKRKGVIDQDWLFEQYVGRGRTLADLAREKNMSTANMARWAHLYQIPLCPRGGAATTYSCAASTRRPTFLPRSPKH